MSVFESLQLALGDKPSALVSSNRLLTDMDLLNVLWADSELPAYAYEPPVNDEIWPLISHHDYAGNSLFSESGTGKRILDRSLNLLMSYHGIVVADPLADVRRLQESGRRREALRMLQGILNGIAEVEPLIDDDLLRFLPQRPPLEDPIRAEVLDFFGVAPDLAVFTNLVESYLFGNLRDVDFMDAVSEIYRRFGLGFQPFATREAAYEAVSRLASAVISLSWQLAVCSQTGACDLAPSDLLQESLARVLIDETLLSPVNQIEFGRQLYSTAQFLRLSNGRVPNLRPEGLNPRDAVAIRDGPHFGKFRQLFDEALRKFDQGVKAGTPTYIAQAEFEGAMRDAANHLSSSAKSSSLRERVRDGLGGMSVGVAMVWAVGEFGDPSRYAAPVATGAATALWGWLLSRRTTEGQKVALRYCASLSGSASE